MTISNNPRQIVARRVELHGRVQGIGLRPAIVRLAKEFQIAGFIANTGGGVHIQAEGAPERVDQFLQALPNSLPDAARLDWCEDCAGLVAGYREFTIELDALPELAISTAVPRDVAICDQCLTEVASAGNRRHQYSWTSCATCGPRFSIVERMPFERLQTSQRDFPLCSHCGTEYTDSRDRRLHAQTIGCAECGPQVWCTDENGTTLTRGHASIEVARQCIRDGRIIAMRGIGGYQLACDATSEAAVNRLRERKRRRAKPLAIMVASIDAANQIAFLDEAGRRALTRPGNPIVLLTARQSNGLAPEIHSGFHAIGIMLPTSALHWMLLQACGHPLVMTSGNVEGKPLEVGIDSAQVALCGIADLWLHHDRAIVHPVDDSVVNAIAGREATIRLGRGYAPLPLNIDVRDRPSAFATGGHQKAAFAIANGTQAILAPHIGDLDDIDSRDRYVAQANSLTQLYGIEPEVWIHDLHPQYFTTSWAQSRPGRHIAVQHHHAHIAAAMVEHGWLEREVLGIAFDGTGYGPDGSIWGGEVLRATLTDYSRVRHLRTFALLGGESAIRNPIRTAIVLASQAVSREDLARLLNRQEREEATRLRSLLERPTEGLQTSSAGRLFDGVSALVMGAYTAEFEGQPAQLLEAICDPFDKLSYDFHLSPKSDREIDWRPVIRQLLEDRLAGASPGQLAMRFHRGLARVIATVCRGFPDLPVILTGGTFQNKVLVELVAELLDDDPQPVGLPGTIPVNDGGLAAGQLAVGLAIEVQERLGSKHSIRQIVHSTGSE